MNVNPLLARMGRVTIAVSVIVLPLWIPITQKPGFDTVCNAIVIGLVFDSVNGLIGDRLLDASLATRVTHQHVLPWFDGKRVAMGDGR